VVNHCHLGQIRPDPTVPYFDRYTDRSESIAVVNEHRAELPHSGRFVRGYFNFERRCLDNSNTGLFQKDILVTNHAECKETYESPTVQIDDKVICVRNLEEEESSCQVSNTYIYVCATDFR